MHERRLGAFAVAVIVIGLALGLVLKFVGSAGGRDARPAPTADDAAATETAAEKGDLPDRRSRRAEKLGTALIVMSLVGGGFLLAASRRWYYERFVGPATVGTLGAIRML